MRWFLGCFQRTTRRSNLRCENLKSYRLWTGFVWRVAGSSAPSFVGASLVGRASCWSRVAAVSRGPRSPHEQLLTDAPGYPQGCTCYSCDRKNVGIGVTFPACSLSCASEVDRLGCISLRSSSSRCKCVPTVCRSRDSVVSTGYGMDDRGIGVRVPVGSRIFSSPRRPDRRRDPPSLLYEYNGYCGLFLRG
jgi:hypothetical protein